MLNPISNSTSHICQALPPQYQMEREIDAILKDPRLHGEAKVASVEKIRSHEYQVVTHDGRKINIHVHYIPRTDGRVGPAQFELEFEPLR